MKNKVPKSWKCNSNPYRLLLWFLILIFSLISLINWHTAQVPRLNAQYSHNFIIACLSGGAVLILLGVYFFRAPKIKQVRFSPEAVYVGKYKIDIQYLDSIHFVSYIRGKHNAVIAFHFCMTFKPNPVMEENVDFFMEFYESIFSNQNNYDYEEKFIDVLLAWAQERRLSKEPF